MLAFALNTFIQQVVLQFVEGQLALVPKLNQRTCKKGLIDHFERAIVLIRDPFSSFWAEYQRSRSDTHTGGILRAKFDIKDWEEDVLRLASYYKHMWIRDLIPMLSVMKSGNILMVKFEDLLNDKFRVLNSIVAFLGYSPDSDRINCSFVLANRKESRRALNPANFTSINDVYSNQTLVCRIWKVVGEFTRKYNYTGSRWNTGSCMDMENAHY